MPIYFQNFFNRYSLLACQRIGKTRLLAKKNNIKLPLDLVKIQVLVAKAK
jgi:hypothetical protein